MNQDNSNNRELLYCNLQQQLKKYNNVRNLMEFFQVEHLKRQHFKMKSEKSAGIDNITKSVYAKNLDANLEDLVYRIKHHTYIPKKLRRCYIPKSNGKFRPIDIPAYEDKLVQSLIAEILNEIYEPIFLNCSFGYRPNIGCHSALIELSKILKNPRIHYVIKCDIHSFFINVDHQFLIDFLKKTIKDKHFIKYINMFIKSEIQYKDKVFYNKKGVPQGGLMSPILANVYLHYVLDSWFEHEIKPIYKDSALIRYCDDFVVCLGNMSDATNFLIAVADRLNEYSLGLSEDKTKIFRFNIFDISSEYFNFLGINVSIKPNGLLSYTSTESRLERKLQDIRLRLEKELSEGVNLFVLRQTSNNFLRGNFAYYKFDTNYEWLQKLKYETLDLLLNIAAAHDDPYTKKRLAYLLRTNPLINVPKDDNLIYIN